MTNDLGTISAPPLSNLESSISIQVGTKYGLTQNSKNALL